MPVKVHSRFVENAHLKSKITFMYSYLSCRARSHFVELHDPVTYTLTWQGRSQKSGNVGAKLLDRKPHLLINVESGSDYYSVHVPAKIHILSNNNEQRQMSMS